MENRVNSHQSGILLHISSLPSDYGIGGLGKEAFSFIDYLIEHNHRYWQILPLNYPGYGDSPYNPISCFAGNPFLIDPDTLHRQGYLTDKEVTAARLPKTANVNFRHVRNSKLIALRAAYISFRAKEKLSVLTEFLEQKSYWLKPFILFCHLKEIYKNRSWQFWKPAHRFFTAQLFAEFYNQVPDCLLFHVFVQFIFERQLQEIKQYATEHGIRIIGDLPLYVSLDSSDVWSNPELFELDDMGHPLRVAGVPPDAFSETGQLWGNPLYRWDRMQEDGFDWWKHRLAKTFAFADMLRLDHFIGFVNYWAVEAKEMTAMNGAWIPGPKHAFFDAVLKHFPAESFIAEDLGILTEEVNALRDHYGFPGMIILHFCFQHEHNDILAFPENKIIYTGTHDNQTSKDWFLSNRKLKKPDNQYLENYLHKTGFLQENESLTAEDAALYLIKLAMASPCRLSIVPMQDILALDDKARMNIPGTATGNWRWQLT